MTSPDGIYGPLSMTHAIAALSAVSTPLQFCLTETPFITQGKLKGASPGNRRVSCSRALSRLEPSSIPDPARLDCQSNNEAGPFLDRPERKLYDLAC